MPGVSLIDDKFVSDGITVEFFPVYYFVITCAVGTVLQGAFYGMAFGWLSAVSYTHLDVYKRQPFTGMDPDTLAAAAALLRERCGEKPVLLATHDREAIRLLGWPVVELENA